MTENSFGMIEDHCAISSSVITEDLNNRERCVQMQLINISNGHSVITMEMSILLLRGIPGVRQGKYKDNSKCDMHDSFTMACLNTMKQLLH